MNKMEEYIIHNNGGRPYKVQFDKMKNVAVFKESLEKKSYLLLKQWKNVKNFYSGIGASVLFELDDPEREHNEGLKTFIHIYKDRIIEFCVNCKYNITQYVSKIIGSDIVYAYMLTEPGGLFVFDTHKIVNIKNPPFGVTDIFTWYYANFNVNTSTTLIDRFY
jgi:hypothetical protein